MPSSISPTPSGAPQQPQDHLTDKAFIGLLFTGIVCGFVFWLLRNSDWWDRADRIVIGAAIPVVLVAALAPYLERDPATKLILRALAWLKPAAVVLGAFMRGTGPVILLAGATFGYKLVDAVMDKDRWWAVGGFLASALLLLAFAVKGRNRNPGTQAGAEDAPAMVG